MCAQESASRPLDYAPCVGMRPLQASCPGQQEFAEPSAKWQAPLCRGQVAEPKRTSPRRDLIDLDRRLNDQIWLPERAKLNCASTRIRKRPPVQVSAVESMNYNRCDQATNK